MSESIVSLTEKNFKPIYRLLAMETKQMSFAEKPTDSLPAH
jgi:hypothetical protein